MGGKPLRVRAFLEGIEIPVISAVVSINPNTPATATLQIVPTDACNDIKPRSTIFLFFRDYWDGRSSLAGLTNVHETEKTEETEKQEELGDPPLSEYRLLFGGEVIGIGYQKTAGGRSATLSCMDFSNYWDTCWYFKGASIFGMGGKGAWADAGGKTLYDILLGTGEMVFQKLADKDGPLGYKVYKHKKDGKWVVESQVPGLLGGIVALLQAIGGIYKWGNKIRGVSMFFALAELRLKLSQQLGVYNDDGPFKLMKRAGFGSIWNKSIKGLGKQFNFRQAVVALSRYIFYEVYPNPAARYRQPTGVFKPGHSIPATVKTNSLYGEWAVVASDTADTIANWRSLCLLPNPTVVQAELDNSIKKMRQHCYTWGKDAQGKIKKVHAKFMSARKHLASARKVIKTKGKENGAFWKNMNKAESALRDIINLTVPEHRSDVAQSQPEFLYTQLFRPDLWFCPPPRCNVIFPDQYDSLSYNRNFLKEVTRLLLRTPNNFPGASYDAMWDNYVFAPRTLGVTKDKKLIKKQEGLPLHVIRDLMEHELYTGVIPHQERARGLKLFGLRGAKVEEGEYKVGYLQRLVNFLFFKYRYATRALSVTGPFNPFVVAGFPALVLDKPTNEYAQRNLYRQFTENRKKYAKEAQESGITIREVEDVDQESMYAGTHYLGEIVSITHQLSQSGGKTSITMGYARTHRENVDPVGTDLTEKEIKKYQKEAFKEKKSYVAAYTKPKEEGRGLYGGEITHVRELDPSLWPMEYPLLGTSRTRKNTFITKVEVGVKKKASEFGPEAVSLAGSPDAIIEFGIYEIVEEMHKEEDTRNLKIPFESYVRPAWYGNCWLNEQIGAVYQELLGTTAITDPIAIGNTGVAPNANITDEGLEAVADVSAATEEDTAAADAVMSLQASASVEQSVNFLNDVYSRVATGGYHVDEFIHSYVWRPIATLPQILGTPDLKFDDDGQVAEGTEGFFSRAFGDYKDLFLLVDENVSSILGVQRGENAQSRLDVRRERRIAAVAYVSELLDRALRG